MKTFLVYGGGDETDGNISCVECEAKPLMDIGSEDSISFLDGRVRVYENITCVYKGGAMMTANGWNIDVLPDEMDGNISFWTKESAWLNASLVCTGADTL